MKLNSFQLKIFAMILMVLDHISTYIPNLPFNLIISFNLVGRIVAPIFFFFIVEGFFHTRSKTKYAIRLFTWALIMFCGSKLVVMIFNRDIGLHNNIFLSLGMSILLMSTIEWIKNNKKNMKIIFIGIIGALAVITLSVFTEASIHGIIATLIFYFLRGKKRKMALTYISISLLMNIISPFINFMNTPDFSFIHLLQADLQWAEILSIPFIMMYNGKRGLNTKFTKYLFYIFYPIHLWIIYILGYFVSIK